MMADTVVKELVCNVCGSEVRTHALFCFHCGSALEIDDSSNEGSIQKPSDVWFRGDLAEAEIDEITEQENLEKEEAIVEKEESQEHFEDEVIDENSQNVVEESIEKIEQESEESTNEAVLAEKLEEDESQVKIKSKPFADEVDEASSDKSKLRSASALRKRGKSSSLKMVEIVWEERGNSPNIWFIIFALILCLIVAALIFLALYIK